MSSLVRMCGLWDCGAFFQWALEHTVKFYFHDMWLCIMSTRLDLHFPDYLPCIILVSVGHKELSWKRFVRQKWNSNQLSLLSTGWSWTHPHSICWPILVTAFSIWACTIWSCHSSFFSIRSLTPGPSECQGDAGSSPSSWVHSSHRIQSFFIGSGSAFQAPAGLYFPS